jgi:hypothetical protein
VPCHITTTRRTSRPTSPATHAAICSITILLAALAPAHAHAQQPVVPAPPAQPITAYRPPAIVLVQPTPGVALPPDRAVLIFRFAAGEASDPLDASSFAVWVNGASRSTSFQVAGAEAWGPLSDAHAAPPPTPLPPGAYQVAARICSSKGACGSTTATVTVAPSEGTLAKPEDGLSRRQRLIDLLLAGARRLVAP